MTIHDQRTARVAEHRRKAEQARDAAAALNSAAALLENEPSPVARHKADWLRVARRLRSDAIALDEQAFVADQRADLLAAHQEAAST